MNKWALVSRRAPFVRRLQETVDDFMTVGLDATPHGLGGVSDPHGVLGVSKRQVNEAKHNVVADLFHVQTVEERECDVEEVFDDVVAWRVSEYVPRKLVKRDDKVGKVRIAKLQVVE
jgi:hypothetical protein